jgi:hypothetical protein
MAAAFQASTSLKDLGKMARVRLHRTDLKPATVVRSHRLAAIAEVVNTKH